MEALAGRGVRGVETFGRLVQRLLEGRSAAAVPAPTEAGAALGDLTHLLPRIEIERYELDRAVTNLVRRRGGTVRVTTRPDVTGTRVELSFSRARPRPARGRRARS
jgi:hypothetical protein